MATTTRVVTEEEKDQPGVERQSATLPNGMTVDVYVLTEYVDDVTGKPGENTRTVTMRFPYEGEQEVEAKDDEGNPIPNGDGTNKLAMEKFIAYEMLEFDASEPTFTKLVKALEPYRKAARTAPTPARQSVRTRTASGSNAAHKEYMDKLRTWARSVGHKVADRGRIPGEIEEAYLAANPGAKRPE